MLYQELAALTGGKATFAQFQTVEKIYMGCEGMTKEQVVLLWRLYYGGAAPRPLPGVVKMIKDMIAGVCGNRESYRREADKIKADYALRLREALDHNAPFAGSSRAYFDAQDKERIQRELHRALRGLADSYTSDDSYYVIYKNGEAVCVDGVDILTGRAPKPRLKDWAYARVIDSDNCVDTVLGELTFGYYAGADRLDEEAEAEELYGCSVEYAFNTPWARRQRGQKEKAEGDFAEYSRT